MFPVVRIGWGLEMFPVVRIGWGFIQVVKSVNKLMIILIVEIVGSWEIHPTCEIS